MKISFIIPSLNRPKQLAMSILALKESTKHHDVEIIPILDDNDYRSRHTLGNLDIPFLTYPNPIDPVTKWNFGAQKSQGDWIFHCSDDHNWSNVDDWLKKTIETKDHKGWIGIQDQFRTNKWFCPFFLASRDWLRRNQGAVFVVPHYKHWGIDCEIALRAIRTNTYIVNPDVRFHHSHPCFGYPTDETYRVAEPKYKIDMDLFYQRRANGFPDDFVGYL